jgi:hypothetical protein
LEKKKDGDIIAQPHGRYGNKKIEAQGHVDFHLNRGYAQAQGTLGLRNIGGVKVNAHSNLDETQVGFGLYNCGNKLSNYAAGLGGVLSGGYAAELYSVTQAAPEPAKVGAVALAVGILAAIGIKILAKYVGKYLEKNNKITLKHSFLRDLFG